jgi:NAD(P)H-hydrate epimerase
MRQIEERAVLAGVSLDALMENAGLAVADSVTGMLRAGGPGSAGLAGKRIVALVGPGNNGGDGLVAARHLAARGARVDCFVVLPRRQPDAKRASAQAAGAVVLDLAECGGPPAMLETLGKADLIVDAVFGTGQNRPIAEPVTGALRAARHSGRPVMALDLPTGASSDTGAFDPNGLPATRTLMLGFPKLGPLVRPVDARCGEVEVLDIGVPAGLDSDVKTEWLTARLADSYLPVRPSDGHKGTFGRLLIIAGSRNYPGAALLAARAATRSGAGLVELATPESVWDVVAGRVEEAICRPLPERAPGELDTSLAGRDALAAAQDATALVIGPGLGQGRSTAEFVRMFLRESPMDKPCVLDADALNILSGDYGWWENAPRPVILTPHPGELARLLGTTASDVQKDRLGAATSAAERWGSVVVVKGAATLIASPDGQARISPWVNSGLAKGGTGDVLAGLIGGLLAQAPSRPFDAASAGVYLHGLAGHAVRDGMGERGMTAGDLASGIPEAFTVLSARASE